LILGGFPPGTPVSTRQKIRVDKTNRYKEKRKKKNINKMNKELKE